MLYRFTYIVLLLIILLLIVVSVVLITSYFSSANLVITHILRHPTTSEEATSVTLPEGLQLALSHISTFLREELDSSQIFVSSTLTLIVDSARVSNFCKLFLCSSYFRILMELIEFKKTCEGFIFHGSCAWIPK